MVEEHTREPTPPPLCPARALPCLPCRRYAISLASLGTLCSGLDGRSILPDVMAGPHPPDRCPTSTTTTRERVQPRMTPVAAAQKKPQVRGLSGYLLGVSLMREVPGSWGKTPQACRCGWETVSHGSHRSLRSR